MVSLTLVVLLACACVVLKAQKPLRQSCMRIRKGSTAGFKHYLKPIILPKYMEHWTKNVPNCPSGKTNGVDVQACSDAQIPELKFVGDNGVDLRRNSNLDSYIVVVINLFCANPQPGGGEIPLYNL